VKKIFFVFVFLISVSAYSQGLSEVLKSKNNGNEAFRRKDYILAIKYWEKYLSSNEKALKEDLNTKILYVSSYKYAASEFLKKQNYDSAYLYYENYFEKGGKQVVNDSISTFNMAFTAKKMGKNDIALKLFQNSIALGYKQDISNLYIADIYKSSGFEQKMKEILISAISQYPTSKYLHEMTVMLIIPLLKEASIPFNRANELAKQASLENGNDYLRTMTLSCEKFNEAILLFQKVLKYEPQNELILTNIKICEDNIKTFNDEKANPLKKQIEN
jgi:tetratricopeptide (TPR) repeat protein